MKYCILFSIFLTTLYSSVPPGWGYLTQKEQKWLTAHPVIKVGIDPGFMPFEFLDEDGNYRGIAADYLVYLETKLGITFKIKKNINWDTVICQAQNKEIDLLPCVGKTVERSGFLVFCEPYIDFYRVIVTHSDLRYIFTINDLQDKIVCVQNRSSHHGYLLENTKIKPQVYTTFDECLRAVAQRKADACVGNVLVAAYSIKRLGLVNLNIAAPLSSQMVDLHMAVRSDLPILRSIINKTLSRMPAEKKKEIRDNWITYDLEPMRDWLGVIRIALITIGVLIILVLFIVHWNRRLAKEIALRIKMQKRVEELSITDELTGLSNRRHFNEVIESERKRAIREKGSICLLMIDIDNFKKYNDTYGHQAGDRVLSRVGKLLKELSRRPTDSVFRLGGEEFALIIIEPDTQKCLDFAETIRRGIQQLSIEHKGNPPTGVVTISIGVCSADASQERTSDWYYKNADSSLYLAKEQGRNKVELAEV